jgi:hypothetical protein
MVEDRSQTSRRRVSVAEASEILGVTVEAVRGRIKRGTIGHEREGDRVFVVLDADQPPTGRDQGYDQSTDRTELVETLRERIEDLRSDRDAWREQARRSDYLLGSAMERTRELENRLRELEAPQETPGAPETVEEEPEGTKPQSAAVEAQEGTQRPWWRRMFGS